MKVGFAGAGGVGAHFGSRMAQGGTDVVLIARGEHASAMAADGVRIDDNGTARVVRTGVIDTGDPRQLRELAGLDWLIFACKTQQTRALAEQLRPHVRDSTVIASIQNGVDNPQTLVEVFGRDVVGGLSIRFAAHVTRPGCIEVRGQGYLVVGEYPTGSSERVERWAAAANAAGVEVRTSVDIRRELWKKLVINNGVNPLSALLMRDSGFVVHHPSTAPLVRTAMLETARAARAEGVELTEAEVDEMHGVIARLQPIKSSMQVDAEKGRELELEGISGAVIARAARIGLEVPVTQTLYRLLQARAAPV